MQRIALRLGAQYLGGGLPKRGGGVSVPSEGVSAWSERGGGGYGLWGLESAFPWGIVVSQTLLLDRQTAVKTLPSRNFV